jgi:hypothetical protein
MLYQLTWQTKTKSGWGHKQFVIGGIGPVHACYSSLITTHSQPPKDPRGESFRAVVTAITAAGDSPKSVVYEWGPGALSMMIEESAAEDKSVSPSTM